MNEIAIFFNTIAVTLKTSTYLRETEQEMHVMMKITFSDKAYIRKDLSVRNLLHVLIQFA